MSRRCGSGATLKRIAASRMPVGARSSTTTGCGSPRFCATTECTSATKPRRIRALHTIDKLTSIAAAAVDRQRLALTSLVSSDISSLSDVAGFFRITDAMDSFEAIDQVRSEEHTSELQSLMRISYAVFCLKKKNTQTHTTNY